MERRSGDAFAGLIRGEQGSWCQCELQFRKGM